MPPSQIKSCSVSFSSFPHVRMEKCVSFTQKIKLRSRISSDTRSVIQTRNRFLLYEKLFKFLICQYPPYDMNELMTISDKCVITRLSDMTHIDGYLRLCVTELLATVYEREKSRRYCNMENPNVPRVCVQCFDAVINHVCLQ